MGISWVRKEEGGGESGKVEKKRANKAEHETGKLENKMNGGGGGKGEGEGKQVIMVNEGGGEMERRKRSGMKNDKKRKKEE